MGLLLLQECSASSALTGNAERSENGNPTDSIVEKGSVATILERERERERERGVVGERVGFVVSVSI